MSIGKVRLAATLLSLSAAGLVGIATHEGFTSRAIIPVPGDVQTIGFGTTRNPDGSPVRMGQTTTPEKAMAYLLADAGQAQQAVARCIARPITQGQFDTMVSLTYNIGETAFCRSTLAGKLNAGDCRGAAAEFSRWNKVQGRVVRGLVNRRAEERQQFERDC